MVFRNFPVIDVFNFLLKEALGKYKLGNATISYAALADGAKYVASNVAVADMAQSSQEGEEVTKEEIKAAEESWSVGGSKLIEPRKEKVPV